MVVSLLYEMQTPCNCFTLSLCDIDQDDGDHGVVPVTMDIRTVLWRWRSKAQDDDGHIISHILIAYDVYLLYILFCLVRR